ncbi:hypothetical protein NC651_031288 [Populus alba x Populus x berolinensis]|nr:hypothetical protein NC651_031288 [Populus alba x Populus x berolinensis]
MPTTYWRGTRAGKLKTQPNKNLKLDSSEMPTTYWSGTRGTWASCYWILIFRHFRKGIPIRKARWERKGTFGLCKRRVKDELF